MCQACPSRCLWTWAWCYYMPGGSGMKKRPKMVEFGCKRGWEINILKVPRIGWKLRCARFCASGTSYHICIKCVYIRLYHVIFSWPKNNNWFPRLPLAAHLNSTLGFFIPAPLSIDLFAISPYSLFEILFPSSVCSLLNLREGFIGKSLFKIFDFLRHSNLAELFFKTAFIVLCGNPNSRSLPHKYNVPLNSRYTEAGDPHEIRFVLACHDHCHGTLAVWLTVVALYASANIQPDP